jgi:hypothetical protein
VDFVELVVAVHEQLDLASVPHAFGGALALGYVANPRGTVDIDVNVFIEPSAIDQVARALRTLGYARSSSADDPPITGIRFLHSKDPFPVDAFPSLSPAYEETARRVVRHGFGRHGARLPFISAEDLSVFKLSFGRPQDWVDLAAIASARPDLDMDYVERQLVELRGKTMYPRVARMRGLLRSGAQEQRPG